MRIKLRAVVQVSMEVLREKARVVLKIPLDT